MSEYCSALPRRPSVESTQGRWTASQLLLGVVDLAEGWSTRRRQRRALLELNDHLLRDIGVSRSDAIEEGTKPFWRT